MGRLTRRQQRRAWAEFLDARPGVAPAVNNRPRPRRKAAGLDVMLAQIQEREDRDAGIPARQEFAITPVPKPRMTHADRWLKRPPVLRYRAFCDELRLARARIPGQYRLTFILPMPESWPEATKAAMDGLPHLLKPDASNLTKALEDALEAKDQTLHRTAADKFWGRQGRIIIEKI